MGFETTCARNIFYQPLLLGKIVIDLVASEKQRMESNTYFFDMRDAAEDLKP